MANRCLQSSGRCELVLNDNKSVFLSAGQISLTEKFAQSQYIYPGGPYEGIELFIDSEAAHDGVAVLRDYFGLNIEELRERYCKDGDTFIAKLPIAAGLLEKTDLAIIEIAGSVGYESQSKFASAFRREFGLPPFEYRKKKKVSAIL